MEIREKNENVKTIAFFDIDGTLRTVVDPWMLLHNHLGTGEQGGKYYEAWREHKISYTEMTELDAALWKGVALDKMTAILQSNPIRKGAKALVHWLKKQGIPCIGISTGMSFLNAITAKELGLDEVISNEILFEDDVCTGEVLIHVEEDSKAQVVQSVLKRYATPFDNIISFGDGPADIAMFKLSTFSVATFPRTEEVSNHADLTIDKEPIDLLIEHLEHLV
ncbi:HAD family phosphatase [Flammeovirga sp. EKP202]|uniref:HAD family hydrolase n=1 Tax=Flammeovirga sp. EKP202 TaxID=2770592 RepID=UPI00165EF912|nr:HAD family phosphatase [Flammeovirga sp. EKP202]MBD0399981.1 HAD family phosphatase [Flammeovirga sp. EKP202]